MYVVIFKAKIRQLDEEYFDMASRMQDLALKKYGCTEFLSVSEDGTEVAISYWPSLAQIEVWRQDVEHLVAQNLGRSKWYESFEVQILEIIRKTGAI
ncbi:MAG: antibiotic biosynthesis monooxygenase [Planctomycetota bacterium]|jgi:heme-degrading monooxygenase HmoA|nr:antibiotic biosynthesis monooxygenase [Planctomycetota bacterium]